MRASTTDWFLMVAHHCCCCCSCHPAGHLWVFPAALVPADEWHSPAESSWSLSSWNYKLFFWKLTHVWRKKKKRVVTWETGNFTTIIIIIFYYFRSNVKCSFVKKFMKVSILIKNGKKNFYSNFITKKNYAKFSNFANCNVTAKTSTLFWKNTVQFCKFWFYKKKLQCQKDIVQIREISVFTSKLLLLNLNNKKLWGEIWNFRTWHNNLLSKSYHFAKVNVLLQKLQYKLLVTFYQIDLWYCKFCNLKRMLWIQGQSTRYTKFTIFLQNANFVFKKKVVILRNVSLSRQNK